jgi:hypothetical protein
MSMTLLEMERAILAEVGTRVYHGRDRMLPRRESAVGQERWRPEGAATVGTGLAKNLTERDDGLWTGTSRVGEGSTVRWFELQRLQEETRKGKDRKGERDKELGIEFDVYEQTKQKIGELQRSYEQSMVEEAAQRMVGTRKSVGDGSHVAAFRKMVPESMGAANGEEMSSEEHFGFARSVSVRSDKKRLGYSAVDVVRNGLAKSGQLSLGRVVSSEAGISDGTGGTKGTELSARAKAILGPYRSLESFWNDKFNQHVAAGEQYLRDGKYYRSASAYTLALIYRPEEALAYMGKSHALFAAGEYVSSALFLSRAIIAAREGRETNHCTVEQLLVLSSKFLDYVSNDKLESRLADVEQWRQRSNSAELQFLLAYIYYQMGRLGAAREAIEGAYEKMPEAPAVVALREVIGGTKQPHEDKN